MNTTPPPPRYAPQPRPHQPLQAPRVYAATKMQFYWLCMLVLSFCYELPLANLTNFHRVNPRLFDVVTLLGIFFIIPSLTHASRPPRLFSLWKKLILWFAFCAGLWAAFWFDWDEAGKFSVFYALKYLQGLLAAYIVTRIPISQDQKRKLHIMAVVGGVFVALYAIPEYMSGKTSRELENGTVVNYAKGTVFSCLGPTYGHVSAYSGLACCMAISLMISLRNEFHRWLTMGAAIFTAWPALVCGSRSGLFSIILAYGLGFIFVERIKGYAIAGVVVLILIFGLQIIKLPDFDAVKDSSRSVQRLFDTEESATHNTLMDRVLFYRAYDPKLYEWQGVRLPLFGGGFYAVPHSHNGQLIYRIGYGVHSGYAFPLEQGGLVAFVLFLMFLLWAYRELWWSMKSPNSSDSAFATGMFIFFIILLLRSLSGGGFWHGNGMENFSSYVIVMLTLACMPSINNAPPEQMPRRYSNY